MTALSFHDFGIAIMVWTFCRSLALIVARSHHIICRQFLRA